MRKCRHCKNLFSGRRNKLFCTNICKCNYHRLLNKNTDFAAIKIDKILHRNRSILYEIIGSKVKQKMVKKVQLDIKKFNYSYTTHTAINSKGKTVYFYYDMSMIIFSNMKVLVRKVAAHI